MCQLLTGVGGASATTGRTVDCARPLVEGANHAADGLVEHDADGGLQDAAAEFEIDEEVDLATGRVRQEVPLVVKIAEWAIFVAHLNPARPIQGDAAGEGFAKWPEADGEVGDQSVLGAAADTGRDAPRQELRIFRHIGHEVEKLFGPVGDDLAFGVRRHQAKAARCASRAARSAAKSASA